MAAEHSSWLLFPKSSQAPCRPPPPPPCCALAPPTSKDQQLCMRDTAPLSHRAIAKLLWAVGYDQESRPGAERDTVYHGVGLRDKSKREHYAEKNKRRDNGVKVRPEIQKDTFWKRREEHHCILFYWLQLSLAAKEAAVIGAPKQSSREVSGVPPGLNTLQCCGPVVCWKPLTAKTSLAQKGRPVLMVLMVRCWFVTLNHQPSVQSCFIKFWQQQAFEKWSLLLVLFWDWKVGWSWTKVLPALIHFHGNLQAFSFQGP